VKATNASVLPATTLPAATLVETLRQRNLEHLPNTGTAKTVKATPSQPKIDLTQQHKQKIDNTPKYTTNISSIPRKEKWILDQNTRHYTLQIVAGENLKTIEEFITEHKLKNNIAFYRSVRKGKPWYGLIYGIYTHKQAAISAINQLPKNLQRLKPWLRSIKSVQSDINKTRS
jgi:septal ring-binding cell division protein DamX